MKVSELIKFLQHIRDIEGDDDVWLNYNEEWIDLRKSDMCFNDGENGDEPGLYIGIK